MIKRYCDINKLIAVPVILLAVALMGGCGKKEPETVNRAMQAVGSQEYEEALGILAEARDKGENERFILRAEGLAYLGLSRYDEAIEALEGALASGDEFIDSLDIDLNYYLATAYEKKGDTGSSLEVYNAILAFKKDEAAARYLRGAAYLKQSDYAKAKEDFDEALRLEPENIDRLVGIITLFKSYGYQEIASEYIADALGGERSTSLSAYDHGRISFEQGDYETARNYLEQARDVSNPQSILYLGKAYEELGDYNYAASVYSGFLQSSQHPSVYNQLGLCRMRQGSYQDALTAFQSGLMLEGNSEKQSLYFNEITAYEYLGDFSKAYTLMEDYLRRYPDDSAAEREFVFLKTRRQSPGEQTGASSETEEAAAGE